MAQSGDSFDQVMIVKADFDGDMRRMNMTVPEGAPSDEVLSAIRTAVAQGFSMEESALPVLKYKDEEGDLCSLVEASVDDMLELNSKGTLRLFASAAQKPEATPQEEASPVVAEVAAPPSEEIKEESSLVVTETAAPSSEEAETAVRTEQEEHETAADENSELEELLAAQDEDTFETVEAQTEEPACAHSDTEVVEEVQSVAFPAVEADSSDAPATEEAVSGETASGAAVEAGEEKVEDPDNSSQQDGPKDHVEISKEEALAFLVSMGFSYQQAEQAFHDANDDVELAIHFLSSGGGDFPQEDGDMFQSLEEKVRAIPRHVVGKLRSLQGKLRRVVSKVQQFRANGSLGSRESEHLEDLRSALDDIKARLAEFRETAQNALQKAKGSVQLKERLQHIEVQIADAQHFVSETLVSIRSRGSELFQRDKTVEESDVANSEAQAAENATSSHATGLTSATTETITAAAAAAADAAALAMAAVDEFLSSEEATTLPSNESSETSELKSATRMDKAQVLVSQSISALRSRFSAGPSDVRWVTVPASSTTMPSGYSAPGAAQVTPEPAAEESATDEFLLADVDASENRIVHDADAAEH